ncbi:LOW QUALITY PROTEIN: PIF-like protein [Mya arenaria]|uniref:PIF-like protein n=1 Tax=Mya arenaria TaxID=6604 RepID=A0ABY7EP82_MYAAR|nr:LOW QUALITY PROTEIN: PIF-like protein [Mya arenaria]
MDNILPSPEMLTVTFLAALFVGAALVSAGKYDYLCVENNYANSVNFYNHPTDCSQYVQCWKNALGAFASIERQCGFGTYWSMDDMSCIIADKAKCGEDACLGLMNSEHRAAKGNCRGYWQCMGEKSVPMCCPSGQHYNSTYGCEDNINEECTADCFGRYVAPVVITNETESENNTNALQDLTTTEAPIMCNKVRVENSPSSYTWNVNGRSFSMKCPAGTVFVQNKCDCLSSKTAARTCEPELLLKFTNGLLDESRNQIDVQNRIGRNGEAIFDGATSQLVIPFFTNLEIKDTLIVRMKYTSDHTEIPDGEQRALFSNFDCTVKPSIQMTENSQNVVALVGTWKQFGASVAVPQIPLDANETVSEKDVTYKFHNNQLSLTVGSQPVKDVQAEGQLRKVQCALHIGYASGMPNFKGRIDEFAVYQCDPNA